MKVENLNLKDLIEKREAIEKTISISSKRINKIKILIKELEKLNESSEDCETTRIIKEFNKDVRNIELGLILVQMDIDSIKKWEDKLKQQ